MDDWSPGKPVGLVSHSHGYPTNCPKPFPDDPLWLAPCYSSVTASVAAHKDLVPTFGQAPESEADSDAGWDAASTVQSICGSESAEELNTSSKCEGWGSDDEPNPVWNYGGCSASSEHSSADGDGNAAWSYGAWDEHWSNDANDGAAWRGHGWEDFSEHQVADVVDGAAGDGAALDARVLNTKYPVAPKPKVQASARVSRGHDGNGGSGHPTLRGSGGGHDVTIKESGAGSKTNSGLSELLKAFAHTLTHPVDSESVSVHDASGSQSADRCCNACSDPSCVFTDCVCTYKVSKVVNAVAAFDCSACSEHVAVARMETCPPMRASDASGGASAALDPNTNGGESAALECKTCSECRGRKLRGSREESCKGRISPRLGPNSLLQGPPHPTKSDLRIVVLTALGDLVGGLPVRKQRFRHFRLLGAFSLEKLPLWILLFPTLTVLPWQSPCLSMPRIPAALGARTAVAMRTRPMMPGWPDLVLADHGRTGRQFNESESKTGECGVIAIAGCRPQMLKSAALRARRRLRR